MAKVMPRDADTQITTIPNKADSKKLVYNDATDTNDSISVEDDILEYQAGAGLNTTYRTRVKTKVLWTGPLSVVSTPTSLDGVEKFSDWDRIEVRASLSSDTDLGSSALQTFSIIAIPFRSWFYSDVGSIAFRRLSDTTFEMQTKGVALGNIQSIIGISL